MIRAIGDEGPAPNGPQMAFHAPSENIGVLLYSGPDQLKPVSSTKQKGTISGGEMVPCSASTLREEVQRRTMIRPPGRRRGGPTFEKKLLQMLRCNKKFCCNAAMHILQGYILAQTVTQRCPFVRNRTGFYRAVRRLRDDLEFITFDFVCPIARNSSSEVTLARQFFRHRIWCFLHLKHGIRMQYAIRQTSFALPERM